MASVNLPLPFEAYKGKEPYIFVSYAHKDGALIYPQLKALHEEGYRIWYDEGIDPGNEWPEEIALAIEKTGLFLVFLTANAVASKNVKNEINYALNQSKPFLAIHLEEMKLPSGLALRMGDIQAVFKWRMTDEHYQRKLQKALPENLRDTTALRRAEEERQRKEQARAAEAAAQAARAKAEQEALARPSIKLVAMLNDREVRGAKVSYGADTWETPVVLNLTKGGSYLFKFSHTDSSGREYAGESQFAATWTGEQTQRIALAPKRAQAASAGLSSGNKTHTLDLGGGVNMEFAWLPAGEFLMGSPGNEAERSADETQHRVIISQGFWMGKTQVTQKQWERLMGSNPASFKGPNLPVETVSWNDCQEFINKLNLKLVTGNLKACLPTEAQWEYACRAGTTTPFHYGTSLDASMANFDGNYPYGSGAKGEYRQKTTEVGAFQPNAWGLYDMHGNIWEWCQDWYAAYDSALARDPTGPDSGSFRVVRGGSWSSYARSCRSARRILGTTSGTSPDYGLRLVLLVR